MLIDKHDKLSEIDYSANVVNLNEPLEDTINTLKFLHTRYFFLGWFLLIISSFFFFDKDIAYYFHSTNEQLSLAPFMPELHLITKLGISTQYFVILISILFINFLFFKNEIVHQKTHYLLMALIVSSILCVVIKIILSRARPDLLFNQNLYGFYFFHTQARFWSFPSGHSTTISAIMIGLSLIFSRYSLIFLTSMLIICGSRIVLGAHYLSDVLAGLYLGTIVSSILYQVMIMKGKSNAISQ